MRTELKQMSRDGLVKYCEVVLQLCAHIVQQYPEELVLVAHAHATSDRCHGLRTSANLSAPIAGCEGPIVDEDRACGLVIRVDNLCHEISCNPVAKQDQQLVAYMNLAHEGNNELRRNL